MTRLTRLASQCLFGVATVLGFLAVWAWGAGIFNRYLRFLRGYTPIELLEVAAIALLFVITLQIREIKHRSDGPKG